MRKTLILAALGSATLLTGCGGGGLFNRDRPDEFAVQRQAPLVVPPDFSLTPPTPGAPRPSTTAQYRAYDERDLPEYGEVGHGPWCSGLPFPPVPIGPNSFKDGTDLDDNPPSSDSPAIPLPGLSRVEADAAARRGFGAGMSSGYAGSEAEQTIVNALLAGESGEPADSYGSLGSLLYGPVVQGGGR